MLRGLSMIASLMVSISQATCAHSAPLVAESPPRIDAPKPLRWKGGSAPPATTHEDGSVTLTSEAADEVLRHLLHYHEQYPRLCDVAIGAQQRVDEGHWRAWYDQQRALEPAPMPKWELALWVTGAVLAGGLIGGIIVGTAPGVTVVR